MRIIFRSLVLSSLALSATAAFAVDHWKADIPFSFTVRGKSFPSGSYDVSLDLNQRFVSFSSYAAPEKRITWIALPAVPTNIPAVVRFDKVDTSYSLKNIQVGGEATPDLDSDIEHNVRDSVSIKGQ